MTLAQLPGYFTAAWLIERAGRKFVFATYLTWDCSKCVVFRQCGDTYDVTYFRCIVIIL